MIDPIFQKYINIPFSPEGDDLITGINCWNLYRRMFFDFKGILLPSYSDLQKGADDFDGVNQAISTAEKSNKWIKIKSDTQKVSDLVLIKVFNCPWHIGMFVGNLQGSDYMIHTNKSLINSSMERIKGLKWNNSFLGFWRFSDD